MSLEGLLEEIASAGTLDARGRLGLDVTTARRIVQGLSPKQPRPLWASCPPFAFQWQDPCGYLLRLVSAGVRSGADRVQLRSTPFRLHLEWRGGEPLYRLEQGLRLSSELLCEGLMQAASLGLRAELDGLRLDAGLAVLPGRHRPNPGRTRLVLSRRRPGRWPELEGVRERCRYCPGTRITVQGRHINPALDLGLHRGCDVVLGRVPDHQFPQLVHRPDLEMRWTTTEDPFCLVLVRGCWFRNSADPCLLNRYWSEAGFVVDGVVYPAPPDLPQDPRANYRLLVFASGLKLDASRRSVLGCPPELVPAVKSLLEEGADPRPEGLPLPPLWVASPEWLALCGISRPAPCGVRSLGPLTKAGGYGIV